jgi:hypothetical protein
MQKKEALGAFLPSDSWIPASGFCMLIECVLSTLHWHCYSV